MVFYFYSQIKPFDQAVNKFGESSDQAKYWKLYNFAKLLIFNYV